VNWEFYSVLPEDKGFLGRITFPKREDAPEMPIAMTMRRHVLQQQLIDFTEKSEIPVKWGHELEGLEQSDEGVLVTFTNGVQEWFSFVIGCDGLHSKTRTYLFGEQSVDYTGVAAVCDHNVLRLLIPLTSNGCLVGWVLTDPARLSGQAYRKAGFWRRHYIQLLPHF
jgi:2-polyprenyl-6-methoxyphenol hydroxylase-like FAD-dependent oxidoreductase